MTPHALRSTITALLAAGAVLWLAGCGASSGPSRAQYVSRANAICAAASAQTGPLIRDLSAAGPSIVTGGPAVAKRLTDSLERLHQIASGYLARLQRLVRPSGDRDAIERFLRPLAGIVDALGRAATALAAGQLPQALVLLQESAPVAQEATAAARAYGLTRCATVLPSLG